MITRKERVMAVRNRFRFRRERKEKSDLYSGKFDLLLDEGEFNGDDDSFVWHDIIVLSLVDFRLLLRWRLW